VVSHDRGNSFERGVNDSPDSGVIGDLLRCLEATGKPMRMFVGDSWIDRVREQE
jgi:hypothetical protein